MPHKVAHLTPVYPPYAGGIGVVAHMMAEGLAKRGWDVAVVTPKARHRGTEARSQNVIELEPVLRIGNAAMVPQLRKMEGYDVIHLHYPFFGGAEWMLFNKSIRTKRTKFILQYHHDADAGGLKGAIFKIYDAVVLPRLIGAADKVVVSSMDYARHSRVVKFIDEKFVEIPLGVDADRFSPKASGLELPASGFTILFVGSLDRAHWFKGLEVLLRALVEIKKKGGSNAANDPHWQCKIVGDGDLRPRYEQQAKELGIVDQVQFLGKVPHEKLPEVYRNADVFVFPSVSRAEAFGLVVLEAMASGLPVITSDLPGVRTLIHSHPEPSEGCGYTFPIGDSSRLAELIFKLMKSEKLWKEIGEGAMKRALEKYTAENTLDQVEHLYEDIIH